MRRDASAVGGVSTQEVADRVRDKWNAFLLTGQGSATPTAAQFADTTVWTNATAYKVNALGKATEQAVANFQTGVKGTNSSRLPGQLAIVGTLLTQQAGRSGRGRIFLGGLGQNLLGQNGRVAPGQRDALAVGLGEFYKALRDSGGQADTIRPVVVSPTLTDSFKITRITMGDVFDTMRSRRNKLVEQRASFVVDAT
jgi:hypothetical protein